MEYLRFNFLFRCFIALSFCFSTVVFAKEKAINASKKTKLQYCLEQAKKHEEMKTSTEQEYWDNLQKAQDFYLCAEKLGDAYSGYAAAGLSDAGVAKTLPPEEIKRLYTKAANAGHHLAAYELYRTACGSKHQHCDNPVKAEKWLLKAAQSGDPDTHSS